MSKQVASGTFRLKSSLFNKDNIKAVGTNPHRVSLKEGISRATVLKYLDPSQHNDMEQFSGEVVYGILFSGLGYSREEIMEMKLTDVFDVVESA